MVIDFAAVDTNVLIYLHDSSDERKRKIAENILADNPIISTQVISEYTNVTRRLLDLSKPELLIQTAKLFENCEIVQVSCGTLNAAAELIIKYQLQIFDSIIVAAAIEAGCTILYSEDMQDGLKIGNMVISNPFA